jgi:hypothetical protein
MAQARRIKPKRSSSKPKKAARATRLFNLPWGLILVILASGVTLGMLYDGANRGDRQFGAGLKEMFAQRSGPTTPEQEITDLIAKQSTEKEFGFYDILPDIERVMPNDLPDSAALPEPDNRDYFLQAASFRSASDAEKLRASLALKGFKSVTQAREVEGKGMYYRVRLGPYADKRKAKNARAKLQKLGVHALRYSVKR